MTMIYIMYYWSCPRCSARCFENPHDASVGEGTTLRPAKNCAEVGRCVCGFGFPFHKSEVFRRGVSAPRKM